jgi:hypothetical protein
LTGWTGFTKLGKEEGKEGGFFDRMNRICRMGKRGRRIFDRINGIYKMGKMDWGK